MARKYTLKPPASAATHRIDYAAELNAQQFEAVTSRESAALVIAGAGSGKTRTLTYRVAWLLEQGISPASILLLTFTNKAAREMIDRVNTLLGHEVDGLWGGTFHSVGNRILRRHPEPAGLRPGFSILDREDQKEMLAAVLSHLTIDTKEKRFPKSDVLTEIISLTVNTGATIADTVSERFPYFQHLTEQIVEVGNGYRERKRAANVVDFDDLLVKTLELFHVSPEIATRYQEQFRHILVDEYQDTNHLQSQLIDAFAARHRNIMVVGDDAQSIYSWRGADFRNILEFPNRYPGAVIYKIETNYRSVPPILNVANAAIRANTEQFEKNLSASRAEVENKPVLVALADSAQQAQFVAQRVLELRDEGMELHDMAVLYRSHFHSMELQMELTRRGIPFRITSGVRFFEQAHVKDVVSFMKFVVNPLDELSFKRMIRLLPGIGAGTAEKIWNQARPAFAGTTVAFSGVLGGVKVGAKSASAWRQLGFTLDEIAPAGTPVSTSQMIEIILEAVYDDYMKIKFTNYENRREDLMNLASYSEQFDNVEDFLAQLALIGGLEQESATAAEDDHEKLHLSSIHQAKGLEWRCVFLIWLTEGRFPSARSLEDTAALEEERRLFYVAVTRAMDELTLCFPEMSMNSAYGEFYQRPSRFLTEIPVELLDTWEIEPGF